MTNLLEILTYPFFFRALIVGSLIAFVCSWFGIFVVLRREVVIGHTIANVSFLGIALGMILGFNLTLSSLILSLGVAIFITFFHYYQKASYDSTIAFFGQLAMALAVILISSMQGYRIDLFQYLFGDILAITKQDIFYVFPITILVCLVLFFAQKKLLQITFSNELAITAGTNCFFYDCLFMLTLALVIATGIKFIGILLIESFLVIPPNIAKIVSRNFKQMFWFSAFFAIGGTIIGLFFSYFTDTPSGAMIIVVLSCMLIISMLINRVKLLKKKTF